MRYVGLDSSDLRLGIAVGFCDPDYETLVSTAKLVASQDGCCCLELNYLASSNHSLELLTKNKNYGMNL